MRRLLPIAAVLAAVLAMVGAAASLLVGGMLASPDPRVVGAPPRDLPAETVEFSGGGGPVRGWFVAGQPGRGAVLLLHAIGTDRRSMTGRARFLNRAGYAVLMIDFQAHGESPGEHVTFGHREARDAAAAARYLRQRLPHERLGVIGVSLGGAAALLGEAPLPADAIVLEAVYPTLRRAVENRLAIRLGDAGRLLAPLLLWQVEPRLGFDPDALAPVERIAAIGSPVLIVGGANDRHTTTEDTRALFERATGPKSLWIVDGAGHEDFHAHARRRYEARVLAFLGRTLR
jgi:fermentation-respiration switch protein FrsA (DUF1100 family)